MSDRSQSERKDAIMAKAQRIPEPARAVPSEPREQLQTASETEGKERERLGRGATVVVPALVQELRLAR
jgi:hypothetical protein